MKRLWACAAVLLLFASALWAGECRNPLGETYRLGDATIYFGEAYPPEHGILHYRATGMDDIYIPYAWDADACRATLKSEPPVYLYFDENWVDVSTIPRFVFVPATSVDF